MKVLELPPPLGGVNLVYRSAEGLVCGYTFSGIFFFSFVCSMPGSFTHSFQKWEGGRFIFGLPLSKGKVGSPLGLQSNVERVFHCVPNLGELWILTSVHLAQWLSAGQLKFRLTVWCLPSGQSWVCAPFTSLGSSLSLVYPGLSFLFRQIICAFKICLFFNFSNISFLFSGRNVQRTLPQDSSKWKTNLIFLCREFFCFLFFIFFNVTNTFQY